MGVPADSEELTPEWLTTALEEAGAVDQAQVTSIKADPVGQTGMTGQLCRLRISYDKAEPRARLGLLPTEVDDGQRVEVM
jgi:hypothetical protein